MSEDTWRGRLRRRWRRRLLVLGSVVLVAVMLFVPYRICVWYLVSSRLDEIREAGYPVNLEELDAWYEAVPDEENAALLYLRAYDAIEEATRGFPEEQFALLPALGEEEPPELWEGYSDDARRAMADFMAANAEGLTLTREAGTLPGCRYPVDFTLGDAMEVAHYSKIRHIMRFLCVEAILAAELGDGERAASALSDARKVAGSLADEPLLIAHLVRSACDGIASASLMCVLNRTQLTDAQAAQLMDAFNADRHADAMHRMMAGERAWTLGVIAAWDAEPLFYVDRETSVLEQMIPGGMAVARKLPGPLGLIDIDTLYSIDVWESLLATASLPLHDSRETVEAIDDRLEGLPPFLVRRTLELVPVGDVWRSLAIDRAQLLCSQTALAVERFRLARGELPEDLSELVGDFLDELPIDPFDGQTLRYRRLETGYVVYSVWIDGKDDDGEEGDGMPFRVYR